MPYSKIDELPASVKDNLPKEAQSVFMGAFNSAFKSGQEEESCMKIAWHAVSMAGFSKDKAGNWIKRSKATSALESLRDYEFNEEDHPRDDHGRWTDAGGPSSNEGENRPGSLAQNLTKSGHRPLRSIANEISKDWKNPNYAAVPYLQALHALNDIEDNFYMDSATSVVAYFLANARSWKGETAKRVKAELNKIIKGKGFTADDSDEDLRQYTLGDMEVEIFSAGLWNGDEYTVDDLKDMVKNFSLLSNEIKPPVKLGHDESSALNKPVMDGQPAYGWVKKLSVVGDKLMATITNVPQILRNAIKSGRYKRVSSEIYWNLKKGKELFKRVLSAVAFLGADAPAVTNLRDLEALFSQSTDGESGSFEKVRIYTRQVEGGNTTNHEERSKAMTDEEAKKLQEENLRLAAALDGIKESTLELKKEQAFARVKEYCEKNVKESRMHPSTRDNILRGVKEGKYAFDESTGYAIPFAEFAAIYDVGSAAARKPAKQPVDRTALYGKVQAPTSTDEEEEGEEEGHDYTESGKTAGEIVDMKVKKYMVANKVDYREGLRAVTYANPKLAAAYIESTPMVRSEAGISSAADVESEG